MKLSELINEYVKSIRANGSTLASIDLYVRNLCAFLGFAGDIDINELSPALIDDYLESLKPKQYAANTLCNRIKPIRAMVKMARRRGYTTLRHTLINLPPPDRGRRGEVMSVEDYRKMLWTARKLAMHGGWRNMRNLTMFAFTGDTWCRLGGLMSLTFERLDLGHNRAVLHEKNDREHVVYFGDITAAFLHRWLDMRPEPEDEHGAVWVALCRGVKPMSKRAWQDVCDALAEAAGVTGPHNPHSIRHMAATEAVKNGVPVDVIKDKCGHQSAVTTIDYYLHTDEGRLRDATDDVGDILFGDDD